MHRRIAGLVLILFLSVSFVLAQDLGTTPIPPTRLQTRFTGLVAPIYLTNAGDGSKRIFIVERLGVIKVVQPGSNTPTVFLDITGLTNTGGERGLLSMAFHPQFATNRRFFVYYTRAADGAIQISEFEASPSNPNVALIAEKPIITIPHPNNNNHNGGTLNFGPDGYLYFATGDGGAGNDPPNNAQNKNVLLGKMLRIDVNTPTGYLIPPTNPFAGEIPGADEIFALGLRNPFRWSFDRGGTRQAWVGDVGQDNWEEVDIVTNGGNYGWRVFEGNSCTNLGPDPCVAANYTAPLFVYSSQNTTSRCSITGGYVYRGRQGALPDGAYIYGDYCTGEILAWYNNQQVPLHDIADFNLVSFGEDEDGELYVVQAGAGIIQKIVPAKSSADFDGDARTDYTVFRPSDSTWYVRGANSSFFRSQQFGAAGDIPTPEDYDGDRITDVSVYRPSTGTWYYFLSSNSTFNAEAFGETGDAPAAGDYDGDGRADLTVFRASTGRWYVRPSAGAGIIEYSWGESGDIPVPSDYDGDGRYDVAVWRPSNGTWYSINSSNNAVRENTWGVAEDIPATGDFDADGRSDLAVFRPSLGAWFQWRSSNGSFVTANWGQNGDVPVVGDYDNDGRDDIAVFRPSTGTWYVVGSTTGISPVSGWGVDGDIPIPSRDAP